MSENIKEAIKYGVELAEMQAVIYYEDGGVFYDSSKAKLKELYPIKYASALNVSTLTGLIQYLVSKFDQTMIDGEDPDKLLVHVKSPTCVKVYGRLNEDRSRESLIEANAEQNEFPYGRFMEQERFKINMMSLFDRTEDAEAILAFASAIRLQDSQDLVDDGISQVATVRTGASTVGEAMVPSPAELCPYRTFLEVAQPKSQFIYRLNDRGESALFEADGGLWRYHAKDSIKEYLETALEELIEQNVITIIA